MNIFKLLIRKLQNFCILPLRQKLCLIPSDDTCGIKETWDLIRARRAEFLKGGDDDTSVFMGNHRIIQKLPSEAGQKQRSVFSFGFGGCTGVAIYALLKNGEQIAALSHYDPMQTRRHFLMIRELALKLRGKLCKNNKNEITKIVATIFHPCSVEKTPKDNHWYKVPKDPKTLNALTCALKDSFSRQNVKIVEELYEDMDDLIDEGESKDLEVVLCSNPKKSYFQTKASWNKKQKF